MSPLRNSEARGRVDYLFEQGRSIESQGEYAEAIRCYELVLQSEPHRDDAQQAMARAKRLNTMLQQVFDNLEAGNSIQAFALCKEILCVNPSDSQTRLLLAYEYLHQGKISESFKECCACLNQDPDNSQALQLAGMAACQQGNLDEGIRHFEKAVARLDHSRSAQLAAVTGTLGAAYHMAGDQLRATTTWEGLLTPEFQPSIGFAVNTSLGVAYLQRGIVESAFHRFKVAYTLTPPQSDLPLILSNFPEVALTMGQVAMSAWPKHADTNAILDLVIVVTWGIYNLKSLRQILQRIASVVASRTSRG